MRHSSMKSTVAALAIAATVVAAAPVATARPNQGAGKTQQTTAERESDRIAMVRQYVQRALRRLGINTGTTIPIPKNDEGQ